MSEEPDLSDDRPIRYIETDDAGNETVVYRASSVGSCIRALVASARKYPASPMPDWFREVLDEGTRMEPITSELWDLKTGVPTINAQAVIELEVGDIDGRRVIVRAHCDGMSGESTPRLREFKKFRDSTWDKFLRSGVECGANYPWQVSVMMHGGGFDECEFVGGRYFAEKDDDGNIIEEGISEVFCHLVTNPPLPLKAIKLKIAKVERLINEGFDPQEVDCAADMYPCPYFKLHDEKEQEVFALDPGNDILMMLLAKHHDMSTQLTELNRQVKQVENWKKEATEGLRAIISEAGADDAGKLTIGKYVLTRTRSTVAERVAKGYTTDSFKVKVDDTPEAVREASAAKPVKAPAKKAAAKKSGTTRIGAK